MTKYLLESLENGSHGIIPDEGLNYFVGQKRITVYKDGKKVLDKEIDIDPDGNISKYNIVCDGDKEIELEPVKDVEEFNVANMLPQVMPEETVLNKNNMIGTSDVEEYSSGKVSTDDNISFLKNFIIDCKAKIDSLKNSKAPGTDLKIQTLKARLQDAESKLQTYTVGRPVAASDNSIEIDGEPVTEFDFTSDLNTVIETCNNILSKIEAYSITNESTNEETDEVITESSVFTEENIMNGEEAGEPIDDNSIPVTKSELDKIKKLVEDKVEFLNNLKEEMKAKNAAKVRDIKKKLIKNQQKFRETISKFSPDTKKAMTKTYGTINKSNADQVNIDNFMEQMRRDTEAAMRAHQTAMDMHNQAVQNHMMMTGMM